MEHGTLTQKHCQKQIDGTYHFERRIVSINSCHKADDGTYIFIGTSKLHGPVRDTKTKTNRLRRQHKCSHDERR